MVRLNMENNNSNVDSKAVSRRSFIYMLTSATVGAQENVCMFGDAVAYDPFMGRWSQLLAPVIPRFRRCLGCRKVLDVGSGTGSLTLAVAATKPHCIRNQPDSSECACNLRARSRSKTGHGLATSALCAVIFSWNV
jgi:hypothetical protein